METSFVGIVQTFLNNVNPGKDQVNKLKNNLTKNLLLRLVEALKWRLNQQRVQARRKDRRFGAKDLSL